MNSSPNSERARLARELHDGLAQELASLGYRLDQVIGSSNLDNKDRAPLRQIRFTLSGLISQVRNEIFELRSNQSKPISEQIADQLSIILANTSINYEITGELKIKPEQQFDLLRSIREITLIDKGICLLQGPV
jgi:signal transduction histidine kinase